MQISTEVGHVLTLIYDAGLDFARWPEALSETASLLDGQGAMLIAMSGGTAEFVVGGGYPNGFVDGYCRQFAAADPWLKAVAMRPEGVSLTRETVQQKADGEADAGLQTYLKEHHCPHVVGAVVGRISSSTVVFALHSKKAPNATAQAQIEALLVHVQAALRHAAKLSMLQQRSSQVEAILDRLPLGVVLLDSGGRVSYVNPTARTLTQGGRGLVIRDHVLRASDPAQDATLRQLLQRVGGEAAVDETECAVNIEDPEHEQPLTLFAVPTNGAKNGNGAWLQRTVALLIGDPEYKFDMSAAALSRLYGLTDAEGRLVSALIDGLSVREISETFGTSQETVRTHLKRILQKTETRRQSELMRLVITSPAVFARPPDTVQ